MDALKAGREREEIWAASVRAHNAQRQEGLARQWLEYHVARQRANRKTYTMLDAHHEAEIQRYEQMLGISHEGETA